MNRNTKSGLPSSRATLICVTATRSSIGSLICPVMGAPVRNGEGVGALSVAHAGRSPLHLEVRDAA